MKNSSKYFMTRFTLHLDPAHSASLIDLLRQDASLLPTAPAVPVAAVGPTARLGRALTHAFERYNEYSQAVAGRAVRHAEEMAAFTHDALAADRTFGHELRGLSA